MTEDSLTHQLAISAAVVWSLEQLKRWPAFRWLQADTDRVNRWVSILAAFCGSVGLQGTMSGSFHAGGSLTITWPSLAQMYEAGSHFVAQLAMQELFYRGVVKKPHELLAAPPSGGSAVRKEEAA
jgi:hypothetical protein